MTGTRAACRQAYAVGREQNQKLTLSGTKFYIEFVELSRVPSGQSAISVVPVLGCQDVHLAAKSAVHLSALAGLGVAIPNGIRAV